MTRIVSIQPTPVVDGILPDGTEMTRLPYPYHVNAEGEVQRQDFWRGDPKQLVGFADRHDVHRVDLSFIRFWADPQRAVGKYPVFTTDTGALSSLVTVIETVTIHENEE